MSKCRPDLYVFTFQLQSVVLYNPLLTKLLRHKVDQIQS